MKLIIPFFLYSQHSCTNLNLGQVDLQLLLITKEVDTVDHKVSVDNEINKVNI